MKSIRFCKKHGETEFVLDSNNHWRCKKCRVDAVQKRRNKVKLMAIEYKGGKCEICGYNKCTDAMEFHHIDPSQKEFGISYKGYTRSFEKLKKELDKCILLCCRCHREIHSENHDKIEKKILQHNKTKIPSVEEIIEAFKEEKTFTKVGYHFNVSDNSVRKWCKKYGLPTHTKEMQIYIYNQKPFA